MKITVDYGMRKPGLPPRLSIKDPRVLEPSADQTVATHSVGLIVCSQALLGSNNPNLGVRNMSDFIHAREYLHQGDVVIVDCDHQCNVRLMDDSDFSSYR